MLGYAFLETALSESPLIRITLPEVLHAGVARLSVAEIRKGTSPLVLTDRLLEKLSSVVKVPFTTQAIVLETMRVYPSGRSRPNDLLDVQLTGALCAGVLAARLDAPVSCVIARRWKGQVPKYVLHERTLKRLADHGWLERVDMPTRATAPDATHAVALGWWYASTTSEDRPAAP